MAEEIKPGETLTPPAVAAPIVEKTFTQAEMNSIIQERLARAKAGTESDEAIKAANEKYEALKLQNEATAKELETLKQVNTKKTNLETISKLGADPEFADYIETKVDKGESPEQYAQNIQKFLEANPKFKAENFSQVKSSPRLDGNTTQEFTNESLKDKTTEELMELIKEGKI